MTVQQTWPIGRPLVGTLGAGLWEVRSTADDVEYRTIFTVATGTLVLLHGFEKRTGRIPPRELDLARARQAQMEKSR